MNNVDDNLLHVNLNSFARTDSEDTTYFSPLYQAFTVSIIKFFTISSLAGNTYNENSISIGKNTIFLGGMPLFMMPALFVTHWDSVWLDIFLILSALILYIAYVVQYLHLKREHNRQLELSHLLIDLQEKERKRIAAELHDSIGQDILILKNYALIGLQSKKYPSKMIKQLQEISSFASQTLEDIRKISQNLRPVLLDRLGLAESLRHLVATIGTITSIRADAFIADIDNLFDKESEINLFRLVQEALNNIIKHSQATKAEVMIAKDETMIHVSITDNGNGLLTRGSEKKIFDGLGLVLMAERVKMLKGTWNWNSAPGTGTTIIVDIPYRKL
jgi:signal transduction histidine kinase